MTCEVHNKEINSQCAELLVRPLYNRGTFSSPGAIICYASAKFTVKYTI